MAHRPTPEYAAVPPIPILHLHKGRRADPSACRGPGGGACSCSFTWNRAFGTWCLRARQRAEPLNTLASLTGTDWKRIPGRSSAAAEEDQQA